MSAVNFAQLVLLAVFVQKPFAQHGAPCTGWHCNGYCNKIWSCGVFGDPYFQCDCGGCNGCPKTLQSNASAPLWYEQCTGWYCDGWCNMEGIWGCGVNADPGFSCDCAGCNGCAGGSCRATSVEGYWSYVLTLPGPTVHTFEVGTNKQYSESKSQEWSSSVTSSVEAGFEFAGFSAKASISGTDSHDIAQSYESTWSSNQASTWSYSFPAEETGNSVWQFVFTEGDSCQHTEQSMTQEFAITPSRINEPCCLPGMSSDAPYYTTCFEEKYMVPNGFQHGCKVAGERHDAIV